MRPVSLLICLALALSVAACGASRTVVPVQTPPVLSVSPSAPAFRLVRVTDERSFQTQPKQRNIPTLSDRAIHDPKITSRAFGRTRGKFGKARGDFLVPEGSSVADLVRTSLASALSRAGGVLVDERDPRYPQATPLDVRIVRFWAYQRAGQRSVVVTFESTLSIKAALDGLEDGVEISASAQSRTHAGMPETYQEVTQQGLVNLTQALSKRLRTSLGTTAQAQR